MGVLSTPISGTASRYGGTGSLSGTTRDHNDTPAPREVLVFDAFSSVVIRRTVSGANGAYAVANLRPGLVVDLRFKDADTAPVLNDLVHSRVVIGG